MWGTHFIPNYNYIEDRMTLTRFWLVWNPSRDMPQVKHNTREAAIDEATRLAKLHPGEQFYILCATGIVENIIRIEINMKDKPPEWGKPIVFEGGCIHGSAPCGCRVRWDAREKKRRGIPCDAHTFADLVEGERRLWEAANER